MTEKLDANIEALGKLVLLTQKNKLEWRSEPSDSVAIRDKGDIVSSVFVADYKGKKLRIYTRRFKIKNSFFEYAFVVASIVPDSNGEKWTSEVVLELLNEFNESVWRFPREKILSDLLNAIRFKVSGAQDLISSLLQEE